MDKVMDKAPDCGWWSSPASLEGEREASAAALIPPGAAAALGTEAASEAGIQRGPGHICRAAVAVGGKRGI